jgi:hypothetical protein
MYPLEMPPGADGTPVQILHALVDAAGLVITVQGAGDLDGTVGAIVTAAPRLAEDHEVKGNGLIVSRVGSYRVVWGAVRCPGGSLAVLTPHPYSEGRDDSGWTGHFIREVLDPVQALARQGYSVGGGGNGMVTERGFHEAFRRAYV